MAESLASYLARIASPSPTPGGGSVAAICGAMAAALARMTAALAVGKKGYEAVQGELAAIEARGRGLQERLLSLADEDARAYEAVLAAMRLPKASDEERARRKDAMQAAYRGATEAPLETMRACVEALELARAAAESGNRNAITDAGVAALLAHAGLRGASLNVRINLAAVSDSAWRQEREDGMQALLDRGAGLARSVEELVEGSL